MNTSKGARLSLHAEIEKWPLKAPFRITGYTFTEVESVLVRVRDGNLEGRGEASGVYYRGDKPAGMLEQIEKVRSQIEAGIDRGSLARLLPAGGARNAVDCALWDLEAKRTGRAAWQIAGLEAPRPLLTTCTVGADTPEKMAQGAIGYATARAIKLKLIGDEEDAARVSAVRTARPDVWLGVDANQGFTRASLERLMPTLIECRVELIEQPYPVGREKDLDGCRYPIPLAADESVQDVNDLPTLIGRFEVVNIKLDKCGGLTHALTLAHAARDAGMKVMVGNMVGTSLAMAPAYLVGQLCDVVDLDGPIFLAGDRDLRVSYIDGLIHCPAELWGGAVRAIP